MVGEIKMSVENKIFEVMNSIGVNQVIFQGPPGTSKTHGAKELIKSVIGDTATDKDLEKCKLTLKQYEMQEHLDSNRVYWDMVQFHPSYSYEDFVRGIAVGTEELTKMVTYNTVNKIFGDICKLAKKNKDNNKTFFLIIDEINRADVATVFGELIYALEYRNHDIATPYKVEGERNINVPDNLYIIGTMNTADKSVGTIDMAIRRRFLFVDILPNEKVIRNHFKEKTKNADKDKKWFNLCENTVTCFKILEEIITSSIKGTYKAKDFQIGHTYFLPDFSKAKEIEVAQNVIKYKLMYQVLPMLREYAEDRILEPKNIKIEKLSISNKESFITKLKEYLDGSDSKLEEIADELMKTGVLGKVTQ